MKNILLCNNSMGIGGVETVILNQISAFTRKGYNVYVMAGKGIYSNKIEELGGKFIEFDFPEENTIDEEKINKIVDIIKKNQITEIHIHKYQCIPSVMPAALITGIPYFAYEHTVWDTKKYYTWNYPIYRSLFLIYFKNAYKIIAITPKTAEITQKEYRIPQEKYQIVHNGIDLELYKNNNIKDNRNMENIVIVSRMNDEKISTILSGIDIFKNILKNNNEAKLNIIGDGNKMKNVEEYLEKNNLIKTEHVKLLGPKDNVKDYLKNADLLLGVDRCVLEAIAMKIPVVITGYDGIKGIVCKENIDKAMEENFSGNNMKTIEMSECIKQIEGLKLDKEKIVEENHKVAEEKLDCYKNYINIPENIKIKFDWIDLFKILKKKEDVILEQSNDIKEKYEWIQKIEKENKKLIHDKEILDNRLDMEIKEKNENIEKNANLKKELNSVYNSKRWKYTEKLSNIFHYNKK